MNSLNYCDKMKCGEKSQKIFMALYTSIMNNYNYIYTTYAVRAYIYNETIYTMINANLAFSLPATAAAAAFKP